MQRRNLISFLLIVLALTAGCPISADKPSTEKTIRARELVWPQPPLRPRIRFVKTIAQPQDLGIEDSFWQRVWGFIAGKEDEWLIRPTGVTTNGREIFIADAGAQALWILDLQDRQFRKIQQVGGEPLLSPVAVALGPNNGIYVTDSYLAKVFVLDIRGKLAGFITNGNLRRPTGIAYDAARDRLYVADSLAHVIWVFTGDGKPLGKVGQRGTGDGEFNFPTHISLDRDGDLYVTDALGYRVQVFNPEGIYIGKLGRHGDTSGDFASPKGVAVDSEGHVYVVDALFDAVQIYNRSGQYLLSFGERGVEAGQFWLPNGVFIDRRDRIYVADAYNQRIQIFEYLSGAGP